MVSLHSVAMLILWTFLLGCLSGVRGGQRVTLADVLYSRLSNHRVGGRGGYGMVGDSFISYMKRVH
jgi:hypothetical protein